MTGRFGNLIRPYGLIKLAILPLLALVALVASSDGAYAACGCFNPVNTSTVSTTAPGSSPDITGTFDIGIGPNGQYEAGGGDDTGDFNFAGVVALTPTSPADGDIPDGALLGTVQSTATLALLNNGCNSRVEVPFQFMEGTTDNTNLVHMLPFGIGNELAPMAGDNPPFGSADIKPPPAVTQYPAFLNAIFDPDFVDYGPDKIAGNGDDINGPAPPIKPRFRAVATTYLSFASIWVVLQQVVFEPGTKLPQLPAIDAAYGYPAVTVLQTGSAAGSATPPIAGPLTDFCTPLKVVTNLPGVTADNPDTPANEGGIPLRKLPDAVGTQIISFNYYSSQRDADGDGYENGLDSCPLNPDTVWNPRAAQPQPADQDSFAGLQSGDGIPDTCDPTPTDAAPAAGGQPTDYDGDEFPSRGDNCPLIDNRDQKDTDKNAAGEEVGDGIGDACDQDPGLNGTEIICIKLSTIEVGGPTETFISPCLTSLPTPEEAQQIAEQGVAQIEGGGSGSSGASGSGAGGTGAGGTGAGAGAGGVGGPSSGIGSLSPVAGTVPAWAAIAAGLGAAGLIGSLGTLASRLVNRRRDD